ncbi:MAG: hypothetical protein ABL984_20135 [Pyrinomonadaceae bacterium]
MRLKGILYFSVFLLFATSVQAQKFLDKPFTSWSRENAMDVITASPWAKIYQNMSASASADMREAARSQSDNRLSGQERGRSERSGGTAPVIARLHSATPIRQALVRLNQLASGYDKMDTQQKVAFDEKAKGLLECAICQSHYVVTMTQAPNTSGQSVEEAIFQGMTFEQMKGNIWIEDEQGRKRELVQFIAPQKRGDSAVFFFPRKDDSGQVLFSESSKEVNVVFNNNFLVTSNRFSSLVPRRYEFMVSKMKFGDTAAF